MGALRPGRPRQHHRKGQTETKRILRDVSETLRRARLRKESLPQSLLSRDNGAFVIGVADIGGLYWCDQKATFSQELTERGYVARALEIIEFDRPTPQFLDPDESVVALQLFAPRSSHGHGTLPTAAPAWERAELEETEGAWGVALVSRFSAFDLATTAEFTVVLVGVTDGVSDHGTVVEVRQSGWEWSSLIRNRVTTEKESQANIYSALLGASKWTCVFRCSDGRFVTQGSVDRQRAFEDIQTAVLLRIGLVDPEGVEPALAWRCEGGRCEFVEHCPVTPLNRKGG